MIGLISIVNAGNYIGDSSRDIKWNINYSGIEKSLLVNYNRINKSLTQFCIDFIDKDKYLFDMFMEAKDIRNVPILIEKGDLEINNKIDLSYSNCINVIHNDISKELSFKIGWDSILIDGVAVSTATQDSGDNLCEDDNDIWHVVYVGGDNDLWYGNSTNFGENWSISELSFFTYQSVGVVCVENESIIAYGESGGDISMCFSEDSGKKWDSCTDIESNINSYMDSPNAVSDSQSNVHFVFVAGTSTGDSVAYYINLTSIESPKQLTGTSGTDNSNHCGIEVDIDDNVYIACVGSDYDDLDIWSSKDGYGSKNYIHNSMGAMIVDNSHIDMDIVDDKIYIVTTALSDVWLCNNSVNTWNTGWECNELDSSASESPTLGVSNSSDIHIIYTDDAASPSLFRTNSSDGINWEVRTTIVNQAGHYPSIMKTNTIGNAYIHDSVHIIYTDEANNAVRYMNYTIQYPKGELPPETPSVDYCNCTVGADMLLTEGTVCNITTECDLRTQDIIIHDGAIRITGGVDLIADNCYIEDGNYIYVEDNSNLLCG